MPRRVLIIPEYNEARTILNVLERSYPHVDLLVVVNDGSTDHSAELVREWAMDRPGVVLLSLVQNQGMSGALLIGFTYVLQLTQAGLLDPDDVVINIDADGQHLPEEIPHALAVLEESAGAVLLGKRSLRGYPWFKWIGNWGLSLWASLLGGYRYHDVECGFRLMRTKVVLDMLPYFAGRRYGCAQEIGIITARRGWKINNRFATSIAYYRPGARVRDGVTNLRMGWGAFVRVVLNRRISPEVRLATMQALVSDTLTHTSELPWTAS